MCSRNPHSAGEITPSQDNVAYKIREIIAFLDCSNVKVLMKQESCLDSVWSELLQVQYNIIVSEVCEVYVC